MSVKVVITELDVTEAMTRAAQALWSELRGNDDPPHLRDIDPREAKYIHHLAKVSVEAAGPLLINEVTTAYNRSLDQARQFEQEEENRG